MHAIFTVWMPEIDGEGNEMVRGAVIDSCRGFGLWEICGDVMGFEDGLQESDLINPGERK